MDLQKNARRFTGFSALYDGVRPVLPAYALACIRRYLGREPEQVWIWAAEPACPPWRWLPSAGR